MATRACVDCKVELTEDKFYAPIRDLTPRLRCKMCDNKRRRPGVEKKDRGFKTLASDQQDKILELLANGNSIRKTAELVGINYGTLSSWKRNNKLNK